jgi:hypothetical protein
MNVVAYIWVGIRRGLCFLSLYQLVKRVGGMPVCTGDVERLHVASIAFITAGQSLLTSAEWPAGPQNVDRASYRIMGCEKGKMVAKMVRRY